MYKLVKLGLVVGYGEWIFCLEKIIINVNYGIWFILRSILRLVILLLKINKIINRVSRGGVKIFYDDYFFV